jgi:integrase
MPHLSPQTLTRGEQRAILRATARNPRDHLIYSLALGTGLRLAEIVGLNVGDVYTPAGTTFAGTGLPPVGTTSLCTAHVDHYTRGTYDGRDVRNEQPGGAALRRHFLQKAGVRMTRTV